SCTHFRAPYERYYGIHEGVVHYLPYENGSYDVHFSVKKIKKDTVVVEFSRELGLRVGENEWETVTSVELKRGATFLLSTPTDGGGENYKFSIIDSSELDGIVPSEGDIYAPDGVTAEQIERLRASHPHYFGLDTTEGLNVYVGQMAARSYTCYLKSPKPDGTEDTFEDTLAIWQLGGLSINDMKAVLSSYGIESIKINILPYAIPYSSYWVPMDDSYVTSLRIMFGLAPQRSDYDPIYDTATFDVDGDGIDEVCSMHVGPTSGRFTFFFTARESGSEEIDYETLISSQVYTSLTFVKGEDGVMRVQGVTHGEHPETHLFDITIKHKLVTLSENGVQIEEIYTPIENVE
ncbi:MAG: hypothetical protein J6B77_01100, partial [Clostridia bacterium]|nr:hypothetical protein [Clostridia bacterium]